MVVLKHVAEWAQIFLALTFVMLSNSPESTQSAVIRRVLDTVSWT